MIDIETVEAMNHYVGRTHQQLFRICYRMTNRQFDGRHEARARAILTHIFLLEPPVFDEACRAVMDRRFQNLAGAGVGLAA